MLSQQVMMYTNHCPCMGHTLDSPKITGLSLRSKLPAITNAWQVRNTYTPASLVNQPCMYFPGRPCAYLKMEVDVYYYNSCNLIAGFLQKSLQACPARHIPYHVVHILGLDWFTRLHACMVARMKLYIYTSLVLYHW